MRNLQEIIIAYLSSQLWKWRVQKIFMFEEFGSPTPASIGPKVRIYFKYLFRIWARLHVHVMTSYYLVWLLYKIMALTYYSHSYKVSVFMSLEQQFYTLTKYYFCLLWKYARVVCTNSSILKFWPLLDDIFFLQIVDPHQNSANAVLPCPRLGCQKIVRHHLWDVDSAMRTRASPSPVGLLHPLSVKG